MYSYGNDVIAIEFVELVNYGNSFRTIRTELSGVVFQ